MNDQEDDKKNLDNTLSDNDNNNQSEVDLNNQPQSEENQNQNIKTNSDNENQSIVDSSNQTRNEKKYLSSYFKTNIKKLILLGFLNNARFEHYNHYLV